MRYKFFTVLLIPVLILSNSFVVKSSLSDFKKDVELEEKSKEKSKEKFKKKRKYNSSSDNSKNKRSKNKNSNYNSDYNNDYASSNDEGDDAVGECMGELIGAVVGALFVAWGMHNSSVLYTDYPYSYNSSGDHICYHIKEPEEKPKKKKIKRSRKRTEVYIFDNKGGRWEYEDPPDHEDSSKSPDDDREDEPIIKKSYNYSFEAGGQWLSDDGYAFSGAIRGKFYKIIGPELEYKRIVDGKDYLEYIAVGVNVPFFQIDPLLFDFYIQAVFFNGIIEREGFAYGGIINIYPGKPLSIMLRVGNRRFESGISFMDYEGRIGFLLNRFELYMGYQHIQSENASLGGPVFGLKIHL